MLRYGADQASGHFWLIGVFMRLILLALCGVMPVASFADDDAWLKKDNPDELYALVVVSDECPVSEESAEEIVDSVLVRSRIKPLESWTAGETMLSMGIDCVRNDSKHIFDIDLFFGALLQSNEGEMLFLNNFVSYGSLGQGDEDFIRNAVKERIEDAITDYIRVNFDLGD